MELLISMSLSIVLLFSLVECRIVIQKRLEINKTKQMLEAEAAAFFHFFEQEAMDSSQIYPGLGRVFFYKQRERFDYQQTGSRLFRERNGTGYVIVCYHVKSFQASSVPGGVEIQLNLEENHVQQKINYRLYYKVSEGVS